MTKTRSWTLTDEDEAELTIQTPNGILGLDEVGRGCVAGPIVAAGVFLTLDLLPLLKTRVCDSKKLGEEERERIAAGLIIDIPYAIAFRDADFIDAYGIQRAHMEIFAELITARGETIGIALIDGTQAPKNLKTTIRTIPKGESHSVAIAAASLIAKAYRDNLMRELHIKHPEYGFADHKGYGTAAHTVALKNLGPIPGIHRRMFVNSLLTAKAEKNRFCGT